MKEEGKEVEMMTKDEMQRFLEMSASQGVGELEAARRLFQVIGIYYPENLEPGRQGKKPDQQ